MKQFRVELVNNGLGHFYNIKPIGDNRYEIYIEEDLLGTILLDEKNHAHCESVGCEIDLPLLQSIRDAIHEHGQMD